MLFKYKNIIRFIAGILLLFIFSCENREWDNPFDPDCPKELFTPANFLALQQGNSVKLSWTQTNTHISGFVIERSVDGGNWASVASPSKTEITWSDSNITGGKIHSYRIKAKAGENLSNEITAQLTPVFSSTGITSTLSKLLSTTASIQSYITSDGGSPVTARGVCWSTSPSATVSSSITSDGTGIGSYTSNISGLTTNTTYYLRAYATNAAGTNYGTEITFKTFFGEVTDIDGNVYPTVKIGDQVWMAENLRTTKYNDGSAIPNVIDNTLWIALTTGAQCNYSNDDANGIKYGKIYNWYAVNDSRNIAPAGWHVASDNEWTILQNYVMDNLDYSPSLSKALASKTDWTSSNIVNTVGNDLTKNNSSGFTALPGGYRVNDGNLYRIGDFCGWWSSSKSTNGAWSRSLYYNSSFIRGESNLVDGFYVRCILGEPPTPTATVPTVSTSPASNINSTKSTLGGNVTSDGNATVTERGIVYATTQNPTTANTKVAIGNGTGSFSNTVSGLTNNTVYYFRAYAINSQGTAYGNEVTFKTWFGEVTDFEGNIYPTVKIGEQVWMAENLKTTKYNDGTSIPNVTDNTQWTGLTTGAYCWYNNNVNNKNIYGALYNWYVVNSNKLAPAGWHIPTDVEWTTLTSYLGGENVAGGKLKEAGTAHWLNPNTEATNESGFTALPGGARYVDGTFVNLGSNGGWWSSTTYDTQTVWIRDIYRAEGKVSRGYAYNQWGYSVRCILGTLSSPTVSTTAISNKTTTSASSGGNITSDGGSAITARGVCWSTSPNPTTANNKTTDGTGTGSFTSSITGLTANTTYYVRAYATNSQGTAYGSDVSFKTSQTLALATVTTAAVTTFTTTTAILGGNVTSDGNATVTERGVVYATTQNPTIANTKMAIGSGTGAFSNTVTGLTANTTYYVRSYAINSQGTAYGSEVSFITSQTLALATVTTTAVTTYTETTAVLGGNVTSDGNATVTERGVVYATTQNPTTSNTKVKIGTGTGSFSNSVTGLTANTTYYVRAYATNSQGTAFGAQESFTTSSTSKQTVTDIEGNVYNTVTIGTQVWMAENLKTTKFNDGTAIPIITDNIEWEKLTTGAYCWFNNDESSFKTIYGALYNWYSVNNSKLCPEGWHVPSDIEWETLVFYLGGSDVAGGKMKETGTIHWHSPNSGATNSSGFMGLPGGFRFHNGSFNVINDDGYWWSSTVYDSQNSWLRHLLYTGGQIARGYNNKELGLSVRCIKD